MKTYADIPPRQASLLARDQVVRFPTLFFALLTRGAPGIPRQPIWRRRAMWLIVTVALITQFPALAAKSQLDLTPVVPDRLGTLIAGKSTYKDAIKALGRPSKRDKHESIVYATWKKRGIRGLFRRTDTQRLLKIRMFAPFAEASTEGFRVGMAADEAYAIAVEQYGPTADVMEHSDSGYWAWELSNGHPSAVLKIDYDNDVVSQIEMGSYGEYTDEVRAAFFKALSNQRAKVRIWQEQLPGTLWQIDGILPRHAYFHEDGRFTEYSGDLHDIFGPRIFQQGRWQTTTDAVLIVNHTEKQVVEARFLTEDSMDWIRHAIIESRAQRRVDALPDRIRTFVEYGGRIPDAIWPPTVVEYFSQYEPGRATLAELEEAGWMTRSPFANQAGLLGFAGTREGQLTVIIGSLRSDPGYQQRKAEEPVENMLVYSAPGKADVVTFKRSTFSVRTRDLALQTLAAGVHTTYQVGNVVDGEARDDTVEVACVLRFEKALLAANSCGP